MREETQVDSSRLPTSPVVIRDMGSFHVGGEMLSLQGMPFRERVSTLQGAVHPVDQNGEIIAGQMYVQYVKLERPTSEWPLLLWHGGGMSGVNWETTPDGRPGWQMFFLRAGFDVYVSDAVERGRASWAPYPEVYAEAPYFRTAREAWEETFRFGPVGSWHRDPGARRPYPGVRFPVEFMETFMNQFVPRWSTNNERTQRAYDALVGKLDASIILTHSQGGNFGLTAALHAPERVKAVISLEPSGAPSADQNDAAALRHVPHLFVWGDFLDQHSFWVDSVPKVRRWYDALVAAGADVEWIDLPARGITGNSHALMADDNSDAIAMIVHDWLRKRGLAI